MRTQYGLITYFKFPDPRLRTIAQPVEEVTDEIRQLAADMFETMYEAPGIGLAATQVDRHIQLIVMDLSENKDQPMVFINPKITPLTEETQPYEEGCLSVPQIYDKVERPSRVKSRQLVWMVNPLNKRLMDFSLCASNMKWIT